MEQGAVFVAFQFLFELAVDFFILRAEFDRFAGPFFGRFPVAFFGVARSGAELLAAGVDGLYRVSAQGAEREPLPAFRGVGGIR